MVLSYGWADQDPQGFKQEPSFAGQASGVAAKALRFRIKGRSCPWRASGEAASAAMREIYASALHK
jgi:hypothetical protein